MADSAEPDGFQCGPDCRAAASPAESALLAALAVLRPVVDDCPAAASLAEQELDGALDAHRTVDEVPGWREGPLETDHSAPCSDTEHLVGEMDHAARELVRRRQSAAGLD